MLIDMSNDFMENPFFASQFIPNFSNTEEADNILLENLDFQEKDEINIAFLPIVTQVPEKKRGIMRVFIANTGDLPVVLSVYYSITGWFSDLQKLENLKFVESISINPSQVWFRDIAFRSSIKQGKNYFQLLVSKGKNVYVRKNGKAKRKASISNFATMHSEYSQIREITENVQIERSNYLGMASKAYINPRALNYWTYYSLFGSRVYRKESSIILNLKILGLLAGITFIVLAILMPEFFIREYTLPASIIFTIISLLSFLSNVDRKKILLIQELDLSGHKRKSSLQHLKETSSSALQKYCTNDLNFHYDKENNTIRWKEGANKMYEKTIPSVARVLHIPLKVKPAIMIKKSEVEEIKDREVLKQKIEKGINLQHEKGIEFNEEMLIMSGDSEAVEMDIDSIKTDTRMDPDIDPIEIETELKQEIDPIETTTRMEPEIEPIETGTRIETKVDTIDIEGKELVTDVKAMTSITKTIDVSTIPEPKKLPKKEKDKSKGSAKDI